MKKIIVTLMAMVLAVSALTGCKPKLPDTPDFLEVVAWDAGYGIKWLDEIVNSFKEQDWVKQKYPNLDISVTPTKINQAENKIPAGGKNNSVDLFFSAGAYSLFVPDMNGEDQLLDLTEVVYNQKVPGEDVLYKDKILESYLKSMHSADYKSTSSEKYFATPWAGGMDGILYNADFLEQLNIEVPRTTDELISACAKIKSLENNKEGLYNLGYSFITSHEADYSNYVFPIWWAQYQTVKGFENFYQGIDGNKISRNIFQQQGRKFAAEVMQEIFTASNGYHYQHFMSTEFMVAQTMMLQGKAVFMMNGDWFDNEMREIAQSVREEEGLDYRIRIMKTPIISAIVDQTPSITAYANSHGMTADEALSLVVKAVDENAGVPDGIDKSDYERIAEARSVIHTIGPSHMCIIPAYASAKEPAIDLLRYMATDEANIIYARETKGAALPFKVDIEQIAPDVYSNSSEFQRARIEIFGNGENVDILPIDMAYPLCRFGNVSFFHEVKNFALAMGTVSNPKTAQKIYDDTIAYWTTERWNAAKTSAGISG